MLKATNTEFHTFGYKDDQKRKYIIRGLPTTFRSEDIAADVSDHIKSTVAVHQMSKSQPDGTKLPLPLFILFTPPNTTLGHRRALDAILYHTMLQVPAIRPFQRPLPPEVKMRQVWQKSRRETVRSNQHAHQMRKLRLAACGQL
ncbi:hypothetical protein WH47_02944 [Habropoda laboriosa]|uniref:Uncharacterized protein n=1 Tax=Habropoda laboriosa TaxID=597456 RepID=A0A0L7QY62_9HYME|nr:hypothetical protein WH47_02944 [Habropoda laboriosa]